MDPGIVFALLSLIAWGTSDFLIGYASKKIDEITTLLYGKVAGLLVVLSFAFGLEVPLVAPSDFNGYVFLFSAALTTTVAWFLFAQAFKKGLISILSPIGNAWGIVTIALGVMFLGQSINEKILLGMVLVLGGMIVTSINFKEIGKHARTSALFFNGVPQTIVAMFLWGIFFVFVDLSVHATSWISFVVFSELISIVLILIYGIGKKIESIKNVPLRVFGFGVANALGSSFYGLALLTLPTTVAAPIVSALPLVAVMLAHFVLKEKLAKIQYLGIIAVVCGIIILSL